MNPIDSIREEFSRIANRQDDDIDLARSALLISRTEYPELDESYYLDVLDTLGRRVKNQISGATDPFRHIEAINRVLIEEEGFQGNEKNYYDPTNSFLNQVLDWKVGIPVTLSLIYIEVGRRAGLTIKGVGLPAHFITVLIHGAERFFIDPFNKGAIVTSEECRKNVFSRFGSQKADAPNLLDPIGNKAILERLLRNLKAIYQHLNSELKSFQMIQWILELNPNAPIELKDRGFIYEAIGDFDKARKDLERYLKLNPPPDDAERIYEKIKALQGQASRVH